MRHILPPLYSIDLAPNFGVAIAGAVELAESPEACEMAAEILSEVEGVPEAESRVSASEILNAIRAARSPRFTPHFRADSVASPD
jgi:hypothetical protein